MLTAFPWTLTSSPTQKYLMRSREANSALTLLAYAGTLNGKYYIFYWQGKNADEWGENGIGFVVRNSVLSMVQTGSKDSERFLVPLLNTAESPVTSARVYASKRSATLDGKNEFYENLTAIIGSIPRKEQILLLADFNARVGAYHDLVWPSWLGQFSTGKKNDNGERMLEMCTYHGL